MGNIMANDFSNGKINTFGIFIFDCFHQKGLFLSLIDETF